MDRLLQCAVPPRYHFITARALYYNAQYRLGTARALYYNARKGLGTARALYYNARYRLGTASVPLGPSITMRGTASVPPRYRSGSGYYNVRYRHPVCVLQRFNWIGVRNYTKTNRKPRNATLTQGIPSLLRAQPFLTNSWAWAWPLTYPKMNCVFGGICGLHFGVQKPVSPWRASPVELELGRPTLATPEPIAFLVLDFGAVERFSLASPGYSGMVAQNLKRLALCKSAWW